MRDLEQMTVDEALEAHAVLDALEDAEWRASQPRKKFEW